MGVHTCEHGALIGCQCPLCGGPAETPSPAPMTIHPEDLREKVARIIDPDLELGGVTARGAIDKADEILSLISSIKEGGTEVLSAVASGLTPLVPSRVPEPGQATPSEGVPLACPSPRYECEICGAYVGELCRNRRRDQ